MVLCCGLFGGGVIFLSSGGGWKGERDGLIKLWIRFRDGNTSGKLNAKSEILVFLHTMQDEF